MNTVPTNTFFIVLLLIAAVSAISMLVSQKSRSLSLKRQFGPEYDRAVVEMVRSKRKASPRRLRTVKGSAYAKSLSS